MKTLLLLFACGTIIKPTNFGTCTYTHDITTWEDFKKQYNKNYINVAEETTRKNIFDNNVKMIKDHNDNFFKGIGTFKMGMNEFGDLTHDEFKKRFIVREMVQKDANVDTENDVHGFDDNAPLQCDWTKLEVVNKSVHDQQDCKSGWAYSAADAIAARYQVYYNKSCPPLCINYLIKCSHGMGNHGCQGGEAYQACKLVKKNKAMPDQRCFPKVYNRNYDADDETVTFKMGMNEFGDLETCMLHKMKNTVPLDIKQRVIRSQTKFDVLKELCTEGPVSASISAEHPSFQFAKEGIYDVDECYEKPNHEVLLVGYNGNDKENAYWLVKNSFGTSWGDQGFLKMSTKANKAGCTIIGDVSYPVFSGPDEPVISKVFVSLF